MTVSGVQTTSNLSNSKWAKYLPTYLRGARFNRVYDALAAAPAGEDMSALWRSSSVVFPFLADLEPGTTAIPENSDVTAVAQRDTTASMTPTSRYGFIQASELLMNSAGTNYATEKFELLGKNMMESVDLLAQAEATKGAIWASYAMTARTSLDAAANYYLKQSVFTNAAADLRTRKVPQFINEGRPMWFAIMHPYAFGDLLGDTAILAVGEYQKASIVLAQELGELNGFKLIVTPWAKTFWGAGAANGTAVETTIATTAVTALAKTVTVAASTNITVGDRLMVGTKETGSTHYPTNEIVTVTDIASDPVIGIAGEGANGGFRFDHAIGATVSNDDSVGTVVFGGPESLTKIWDPQVGEYGEMLPPERDGALKQFYNLAWKWYGGYDLIIEGRLHRYECTFSRDA